MKGIVIICLSFLSFSWAVAQNDSLIQYYNKTSGQMLDAIVVEGDTIPMMVLDEVLLVDKPSFSSSLSKSRYYILRRKVIKVYPYAVIAGNKLDSLNLTIADMSKRKKKRYIKKFQNYLESEFKDELKDLTRTEGQILSKLISRETNLTTYDLISTYRSGWNAFWWNAMAAVYDISLKIPYDPKGNEEDKLIEVILQRAFSQGLLTEREKISKL